MVESYKKGLKIKLHPIYKQFFKKKKSYRKKHKLPIFKKFKLKKEVDFTFEKFGDKKLRRKSCDDCMFLKIIKNINFLLSIVVL